MRKVILALGAMQAEEMARLEESCEVIKLWKERDPEAALQDCRMNVQVILSTYNGLPVTRRMIESLPNLELIAQYGAGLNNIDVECARQRHISVVNTPDSPTKDTADTAIILMMAVMRRIVEADMFVRVGKWSNGQFPLATSLSGKTVGICGMGRIGQAIARRCNAFDMNVIYHGPREKNDLPYQYIRTLESMAKQSHVLIMACPGGESTHHIADEGVFSALGNKGFFVNVARGSVVKTDDLLVALSNKTIAGAGLDVYENEPQVPEVLLSMDNVVLLPHIGGGTYETRANMGQLVIANIEAHFSGEPLLSPIAA